MEAGACLGIPAYTGYQAVLRAGAHEGSTVLVAAGAGAVGHYAIQFAKQRKATVITTVSSPAKAEIARQAGADHVIDYKREDVGERVMAITAKRGVDAVIEMDLAANARLLPNVLAPNGVVAIYGSGAAEASIPFQFLLQNSITLQFFLVYLMPPAERERATADITRMLERGDAHPQCGANLRSRRHGRRPRSGRKRKGDGQYRGQAGIAGHGAARHQAGDDRCARRRGCRSARAEHPDDAAIER